jgi:MtN3 and saliva related transmembrane protein
MIELIGHLGALLLSFSSAPQLYTTFKTKDVTGLSLNMLLLWGVGCLLMGIYVVFTSAQMPLVINYSLNTALVFTNIILYFKYRPR